MLLRSSDQRARGPRSVAAWLVAAAAANAGAAVYGTVMVGVLLAAEDAYVEGYSETIGSAVLVLVLYWLMSCYTHALGERLQTREPLNARLFRRTCVHELPIIEGALIPVLALLVGWAAGVSVTSAVTIALWSTVVSIVALEGVAGSRAGLRRSERWLQVAGGALLGLAIIGLKLILH